MLNLKKMHHTFPSFPLIDSSLQFLRTLVLSFRKPTFTAFFQILTIENSTQLKLGAMEIKFRSSETMILIVLWWSKHIVLFHLFLFSLVYKGCLNWTSSKLWSQRDRIIIVCFHITLSLGDQKVGEVMTCNYEPTFKTKVWNIRSS